MKWVFVALLVLNGVLLSVQILDARNEEPAAVYKQEKGSKSLVLLEGALTSKDQLNKDAEMCVLVGPILKQKSANELLASMSTKGLALELVVQEVNKAPSYWVYFDDFGDMSIADNLKEFKGKGIESYIISSGKLQGLISLGVFENIDLAQGLKKMMKKRGYQAKISELNKFDKEYWLLSSSVYAAENKQKIDGILMSSQKMLGKREIFCKSVASIK